MTSHPINTAGLPGAGDLSPPRQPPPGPAAASPQRPCPRAPGQKADPLAVPATDQKSGALKLLKQYPTGKGSNWVEIVTFD